VCSSWHFLAFQASDVALSQVVVGGAALPALLLIALAKSVPPSGSRARTIRWTAVARRAILVAGLAGLAALCLWRLAEVPGVGDYRK
jgi:multisubunit Na+/H+ antiporter MnhB subunit